MQEDYVKFTTVESLTVESLTVESLTVESLTVESLTVSLEFAIKKEKLILDKSLHAKFGIF